MTDDDRTDRRRRVVMSDDDRALSGGRARSASGEIDNADTLDDDAPDPSNLTPVGTFADRYNDPDIRRLAIDLDRRQAHRTMQAMAKRPLGEGDRDRIESVLERQHDKHNELRDVVELLVKGQGEHTILDNERHKRLDEFVSESKADRKSSAAGRWSLIVGVVTALGAASVAFYNSTIAKGEENATLRQLVDQSREHDRDIEQIRAQLFRAFVRNPFMPDDPALSGDPP